MHEITDYYIPQGRNLEIMANSITTKNQHFDSFFFTYFS